MIIEGLTADVTVFFDEYGVPHIFAENEHDLFFAQGYITARERMFSMDVTRLAGRGKLSSIFADIPIDDDK
jgi:penicillin amidase